MLQIVNLRGSLLGFLFRDWLSRFGVKFHEAFRQIIDHHKLLKSFRRYCLFPERGPFFGRRDEISRWSVIVEIALSSCSDKQERLLV